VSQRERRKSMAIALGLERSLRGPRCLSQPWLPGTNLKTWLFQNETDIFLHKGLVWGKKVILFI
jgi:hypothetical protein